MKLPLPSPEAQRHSDTLKHCIAADIGKASGWISFARFMELALYAPGQGYYAGGAHKFGPAGDFITAPAAAITTISPRCRPASPPPAPAPASA